MKAGHTHSHEELVMMVASLQTEVRDLKNKLQPVNSEYAAQQRYNDLYAHMLRIKEQRDFYIESIDKWSGNLKHLVADNKCKWEDFK